MDKHVDTRKEVDQAEDISMASLDDLDELTAAAEAAESARQRFSLVVDATGSMQSWWRATRDALHKTVDEISSRSDVPFQIKIVAYRDHEYDHTYNGVTQASAWSNDIHYLKEFIDSISCGGGGDFPESIGHGLQEIIQQQASQVILMGDAPSKEGSWGWDEAKICGKDQCPIYALYVNDNQATRECFEKLARLSGGKAMHLKSANGFDDIMKVILISNKKLMIDYTPTTEEGKRAKALLG